MATRVDRLNGTGMPNQVGVPPVSACRGAEHAKTQANTTPSTECLLAAAQAVSRT